MMREPAPGPIVVGVGVSVLVVDDHIVFAEALQARLSTEAEFTRMDAAYTAEQAYAAIVRDRPDVVLLDLMLGDEDSLGLVERAREVSPESVIVVLTGIEEVQAVATAMRLGVRAWVPKTTDVDQLVR